MTNKTKVATSVIFPVITFKKIESPYEESGGKDYMMVLSVKDLPEVLEEWREVNVRDSKLSSGVAKKIGETLRDDPDSFFFKNRGITLLVDKVQYDNKTNNVEIKMIDKAINGLLDGGHTYSVIREFLSGLSEEELKELSSYVKVEILEGISDYETAVGIVEARNTSTQVKEQSIQELLNQYEEIKNVLAGKAFADRIAYKEFELLEDGTNKDIDVKEILSYLLCFDAEKFKDEEHPIKAYSTKTAVVNDFKDKDEHKRLLKYIPLLPKILELRDEIYLELPEAHNNSGGKFGNLTGVIQLENRRVDKVFLPFTERESSYRIPNGFIYPVLAAFRSLVNYKKDPCEWKTDPVKLFQELKFQLSSRVCDQAKQLKNPNKLGKDKATWGRCYDLVNMEVLKKRL
jgi:hypothetical protein